MRILLISILLTLLNSPAFATRYVIAPAGDNRLEGTGAGASNIYVNSGSKTDALVGYVGTTGLEYGKFLVGFDISSVTDGEIMTSCSLGCYNDLALADNPEIIAARAPSDWKPGTANSTFQAWSSSYTQKGANGTMLNGLVRTGTGVGDSVAWSSSGGDYSTSGCPTVTVNTQNQMFYWVVTTQVSDTFTAGINYVSFLLFDQSFVGGASHERCRFLTVDNVTTANRPTLIINTTTAAATPAQSLTLITLAGGTAGALTNYPVRVKIPISGTLGWMAEQQSRFYVYNSDSTTKLYWCDNYSTADSLDIFVGIPSTGNTDSIYIAPISAQAASGTTYHNCDSVFLFFQSFEASFQFTTPAQSLETMERASRDTVSTNPFFRLTPNLVDSIFSQQREHSNIFDDSTDTNPARRYKFASSTSLIGTTYNTDTNTQLAVWTSPDAKSWNYEGRILLLAGIDTIQMEDPFWFSWRDSTYIAFEDKRNNGVSRDNVGLIVSPDHGLTWFDRGAIIDSSGSAGNNPVGFNPPYDSPSSPVVWIENDTINVIYEGKLGNYKFGGVTYDLVAGSPFLARGPTPYTLTCVSNPDTVSGDTHSPIIRLGANGTFNDYGMVPHTVRKEGTTYYVDCAASSGGALSQIAWFKTTNIVDDWTTVTSIDNDDARWITYGVAVSDMDADYQIWPYSGLVNQPLSTGLSQGVIYGLAMANNDIGWRSILTKQSNTGNPLDLQFHQSGGSGAKGFGFSGFGNSVLSLEAEPLSEKNAVGVYTATDSFDVNFLVDVRLKFTASTFGTDPYFIFSMGQGAVTNIAGGGGSSWEHTDLANGFGLQATGSAAWQPFVQPEAAARSTSGFSTMADASYTNQHWIHMGMSTDTLRWGINWTIDQKKLNDSLDGDKKKIALFAGAHTSSLLTGARAEIDRLQIRKWNPFGPTQSNTPRVTISTDLTAYQKPALGLFPFGIKPYNQ